jgi:hypothetical protein
MRQRWLLGEGARRPPHETPIRLNDRPVHCRRVRGRAHSGRGRCGDQQQQRLRGTASGQRGRTPRSSPLFRMHPACARCSSIEMVVIPGRGESGWCSCARSSPFFREARDERRRQRVVHDLGLPSAVPEPARRVFLRSARRLHDAVHRGEGRGDDLSHIRLLGE